MNTKASKAKKNIWKKKLFRETENQKIPRRKQENKKRKEPKEKKDKKRKKKKMDFMHI